MDLPIHKNDLQDLSLTKIESKLFNAIKTATLKFIWFGYDTISIINKLTGLIGKISVLVIASPVLILIFQAIAIYFAFIAKKVRKSKEEMIKLIKSENFASLKKDEEIINNFYKSTSTLASFGKGAGSIFFKRMSRSANQISQDLLEVKNCIEEQYLLLNNEFSKEDLEFLSSYWDKYKKANPAAYKILESDKSGEEVVFNLKKRK